MAFNFERVWSVGLMWLHHLSIEDTLQGKVFSVVSILSLPYFKPSFSRPTEGQAQAYTASSENECRRKSKKKKRKIENLLFFSIE